MSERTSSREKTLCLETLREGGAVERFNDELEVVLANLVDKNTSHKTKRKIVLTVEFLPDEDRAGVDINIKCKSELAPPKPVTDYAYLQKKGDRVTGTRYNPQQPELPMVGRKEGNG